METSDRGVLDVERFDLEPDRPIFHGLLPGLHSSDLAGLTIQQKAPYVLRILGAADVTSRGAASLLEVGEPITGWPQLGSEVTLGAATAAAAVRRFGLTGDLPSGRVRFDVEEVLSGIRPVELGSRRRRRAWTSEVDIPGSSASTSPGSTAPPGGYRSDRDDRRRGTLGAIGRATSSRGASRPTRTRSACTSSPSARRPWTCVTGAVTSPSAPRSSTPVWPRPR